MAAFRSPFSAAKDDRVRVRLSPNEREALESLLAQYREMLRHESQASDPAVARLFPPAYRDDPLRNLDYDRAAHDGLLTDRLTAIEAVQQQTEVESMTTDEARTWLVILNDLRLVFGTRLDISEETTEDSFEDDPSAAGAFGVYQWLTYLVGTLLEALDPSLADLEGPPPSDAV